MKCGRILINSFPSSICNFKLSHKITASARPVLRETLFIDLNDPQDYRLNSCVSLSAAISPELALKTSVESVCERKPVPGFKSTDTYPLSSLITKI